MDYQSKKVILALSGGVDSAVAAALLKKQGYDVVGVYFRFFNGTRSSESQAKKIAKKLDIPLRIVDVRKDFKKRVVRYFLDSYKKGLTPNPCVVCNKEMKFRLLFDLMKKYKFNCAATGHYTRIGREIPNPKSQIPNKFQFSKSKLPITNYKLLSAGDKSKDQSYFLYRLSQKELSKIIFPLGDYEKSEVKRMAEKMGLPVAENESQDICFIKKDLNSFLSKNIKIIQGDIVLSGTFLCSKNKVCKKNHVDNFAHFLSGVVRGKRNKFEKQKKIILGKHRGLPLYTIGQRKGIEIGPPTSRQMREAIRASGPGPYFALQKNTRKNELIVTNNPDDLLTKEFLIGKENWINNKIKFPLRAKVQIRYHADKIPAIIKKEAGGKYAVQAKRLLRAVTSGQSAVFYKNGEVLGGGVII